MAPIAELEPGTWFVYFDRADDAMLAACMGQLVQANAIIFDLRHYIQPSISFLGHLAHVPIVGARSDIAHITSPERATWE